MELATLYRFHFLGHEDANRMELVSYQGLSGNGRWHKFMNVDTNETFLIRKSDFPYHSFVAFGVQFSYSFKQISHATTKRKAEKDW